MPFLQQDRAPLDAKRAADWWDQANLLLYALLLAVAIVIILCWAMLLTAEARPEPPTPHNTCEQTTSWAEWDAMLLKYPEDATLKKLYALRVDLCKQVKTGKLTVAEGTARFEQARQALMERAKRPRAEIQSKH